MPDQSEVVEMVDVRVGLVSSCLDEADLLPRVEQSTGEDAPGRSCTDDDVVESLVRELGGERIRVVCDVRGHGA